MEFRGKLPRSGSVPALGIGFERVETCDTLETKAEVGDSLVYRHSASSGEFRPITRELRAATPVSITIPTLYQGKKSLKQVIFLNRKSITWVKKAISADWLKCKHISPQIRSPSQSIPTTVSLSTIYPCYNEKRPKQRVLLPVSHALALSYTLPPAKCHEGMVSTLPIHHSAPSKPKSKLIGWEIALKRNETPARVKLAYKRPLKLSNIPQISIHFPKYRIPVEYNMYRNVRKYVFRKEVVADN